MRLKQIKLAGFKSFVDVTKIPFNQPLTAIIGPNGCGKSNVIDAVRWVLGESSAKHLRGDSMADVIFNGSSARRPISVASVELLFDNQEGRLAGQYASYQEIAVKRQVSRDGDSNYFLNGQKCRRKDITDLFMGTGLGPRSYAIIEQGTISRLIESKPQELRVFIEEAAGISRYKERRRETENRIRHTRENLERLGDIRQELGRQLEKLAEQAEAAKQYRELKQTEREQDAQLNVSRLVEFEAQLAKLSAEIVVQEREKSQQEAVRQTLDTDAVTLKVQLDELDQQEHQQVEAFYLSGTQIAKLEQSLKHRQEQDTHLNTRINDIQQKIGTNEQRLQQLDDVAKELLERFQQAQQQQQNNEVQLELIDEQLSEAELTLEQNAERLNQVRQQQHQQQLLSQNTHSELKHLTQNLAHKTQQKQALETQLVKLSEQHDDEKLVQLNQQSERLAEHNQQLISERDAKQQTVSQIQQQDKALLSQIDNLSQSLAEKRGRYQVVEHLLPQTTNDDAQALWQTLSVEPGWEVAVDLLLEGLLTHQVHETETATGFIKSDLHRWQGLTASVNLTPWLSHLHWAKDLPEAKVLLASIKPDEKIVTADGYLIGHGFVLQKSAQTSSLVQLKMEQEALSFDITETEQTLAEQRVASKNLSYLLQSHDEQLQQINQQLQETQLEFARVKAQVEATQIQNAQAVMQQQQLSEQLKLLENGMQQDELQIQHLNQLSDDESLQIQTLAQQLESVSKTHQESSEQSKRLRQTRSEWVNQVSQSQRQLQSIETEKALNLQQQQQTQQQLAELSEALSALNEQLDQQYQASNSDSSSKMQQQLSGLLEQQQHKQHELNHLRSQQAQLQSEFDELGSKQKQQLGKIEHLTQAISALKLRREGLNGQADGQRALLRENEIDIEAVKNRLDNSLSVTKKQKLLERTRARIAHLGAINLAAIEEFEQQSERKQYLDHQDADLNKAINSLEEAIRKIDKETKTRFKVTFDKVNQDLGLLFPKVFGGGSAHLALTDDDLLETGVTIMARPPGKKNSTIHLLSGGEKALTALSLVFAIFRLNPAPFCMLDEVDAPLDDANVERFCRLVKEMSQSVQFVYISHNKITMELADQLIGVTMHEPGVSRIVAVDIDEAVALADAG